MIEIDPPFRHNAAQHRAAVYVIERFSGNRE
jgi:hypothetical protein